MVSQVNGTSLPWTLVQQSSEPCLARAEGQSGVREKGERRMEVCKGRIGVETSHACDAERM